MFSVQTNSRAHHITVAEQWVSGGGALHALKGSGRQASKQTRSSCATRKAVRELNAKRLYGVLACRSSARGSETVSQSSSEGGCEQDRRREDSPDVTCVRLEKREQGRVRLSGKWCLQTLRLEKTQWSGFELGRRKLGNGRSRGCKCWCAGKRKGQGWG